MLESVGKATDGLVKSAVDLSGSKEYLAKKGQETKEYSSQLYE